MLAFWDLLVTLLVLFPLLTGGVWIERPGMFVELSDLGIPVLVLGVLWLILKKIFGVPLERSRTWRLAMRVWSGWTGALERHPWPALLAAGAWVGGIWALAALRRHWNFGSHSHDLGIFTNTLWNWVHGFGYVSGPKDGMNLFADHQSPILLALAPAFALVPRPETLLVLQSFGLAAGGVVVYWLARQQLTDRWAAAAFPLLYWAYLPLRNANLFDFHPEVFMLPLFLAAILGLQSQRGRVWGALAFLLALACKESAGPVAVGVGLGWVLGAGPVATRDFTRRLGWGAIALGLAVFVFDLKVVPTLFDRTYPYTAQYDPSQFLGQLFGRARLKYLFWTLAPLAFLPLLRPRALVAALPGYLMIFLTQGDHRVSIGWHYVIEPAVGLFWAATGAMAPAGWILFWALGTFGRSDLFTVRIHEPGPHAVWLSREFLPCVNPSQSLTATETLVPHLATRHWVHHMPNLARCAIQDKSLNDYMMTGEGEAQMYAKLRALQYREVYTCGTLKVWESPGIPMGALTERCLQCIPECR